MRNIYIVKGQTVEVPFVLEKESDMPLMIRNAKAVLASKYNEEALEIMRYNEETKETYEHKKLT